MKNVNGTEEFSQLTQNGSVYVQFSANWCGPCKMLTRTIENIEDEETDITFLKVDVDSNRDIAQQYGVRSIPKVVLLKDGDQVGEFMGMKHENELKEIFEKTLK
jgi:thioredoxin 1